MDDRNSAHREWEGKRKPEGRPMLGISLAVLLLAAAVGATGYCKLTLLNRYHFRDYLSVPRARLLYWTNRVAALVLAGSIAYLGYATHIWFFALPLYVLAAFALYVNARATYLRLFGDYEQFYRERGIV